MPNVPNRRACHTGRVSSGSASTPAERVRHAATRVSTLELLFDLVFVYTITQVTEVIVEHPTWLGAAQAALTLAIVFWMYDGYAWLTNQSADAGPVLRFGLIAAMVAFLLLAIAIPDAFGASGVLFGVAYLAIVLIHFTMFMITGSTGARRGMLRIGPFNVVGAVLLIISGLVTGPMDWVFFAVALAVFAASTITRSPSRFDIGASHFVERHGLLMIIAFGESIVSVGIGAARNEIGASLVVGAVLCVGIVAAMWWCYFSGDDDRADERFTGTAAEQRPYIALTAFGIDHTIMIFGLVVFAAGVKFAIEDVFAVAPAPTSWLLAGGVALYLLGDARYRQELAIGPSGWRYVGAVVAAPTGLLGLALPVAVQLAVLLLILAAVIAVEALSLRRAR
jgi:low temperature requirement protein LtrA